MLLAAPACPETSQDREARMQATAIEPVLNLEKTYASMREQKRQCTSALKVLAHFAVAVDAASNPRPLLHSRI
jgi:hypothetical protein